MAKLNEPDDDGNPFLSLADLLSVNVQAGNLATVIEKVGICGWDEYGRYKHFPKDEAQAALDALAKAMGMSNEDAKMSEADDWGWSAADLPDIESLTLESIELATRKSGQTRSDKTAHRIIAAICLAHNIDIRESNTNRVKMIRKWLDMLDIKETEISVNTIKKHLYQASLYMPPKDKH